METTSTKINFNRCMAAFCLIFLFNSCAVEKNNDQILKHSTPDTVNKQANYGSIKDIGRMKKIDRDGFLFDEYIANDFHLPKKKRDSAAVVDYFAETSFAQLGRREFRQWDLVVIRGILFQVNVQKNPDPERPLFPNQSKIELMGMIFLLMGVCFF
jgi:hypothetical protein